MQPVVLRGVEIQVSLYKLSEVVGLSPLDEDPVSFIWQFHMRCILLLILYERMVRVAMQGLRTRRKRQEPGQAKGITKNQSLPPARYARELHHMDAVFICKTKYRRPLVRATRSAPSRQTLLDGTEDGGGSSE
jgi:hypothetical protein